MRTGGKNLRVATALCITLIAFWAGCKPREADTGKVPITTSSEEARKEFVLGRDALDRGQTQSAAVHISNALAKDSNLALAYLSLAQLSPTSMSFYDNVSKAASLSGMASRGEQLLILAFQAGENNNPTLEESFYDTLIALYPRDERAHFTLGTFYQFTYQDYARAADQYRKAIELDSTFAPAFNVLGYSSHSLDQNSQADVAFRKYIQLSPNDPNAHDSYGEFLLNEGRFEESTAQYTQALALDSMFITSHVGIAANLLYLGKPDEGQARLQTLLGLVRNDLDRRTILTARIVHYVDAGKTDPALHEVGTRFALAEQAKDFARMANDRRMQGSILVQAGRIREAEGAYASAAMIAQNSSLPQSARDYSQRYQHSDNAMVALKKKDFTVAEAECDKFCKSAEAIHDQGSIRDGHALAGEIALDVKKYDKAIAELQQADQASPYVQYLLSMAHLGKGDRVNAKMLCAKAAHSYAAMDLGYAFIRTRAEQILRTL
ncbi:MAG TPA: hypothetical protein VL126_00710 [Bacteroidota bacterium]|nr:hypothetical protein [Bacteroidota bacterium]